MAPLLLLLALFLSVSRASSGPGPEKGQHAEIREPLLAFKASLTNATTLSSWSAAVPGHPCDPSNSWYGVTCLNGQVVSLRLAGLGLAGTVNVDALAQLPQLRNIWLSNNNLSGSLPTFSRISSLRTLHLSNNGFSGPIGDDFFNLMHRLRWLHLSGNALSGSIPASVSKSRRLVDLRLEGNRFSGAIPKFNIPGLKFLNLSHNELSGPIPPDLAAKFDIRSFLGNAGLCGGPLKPCLSPPVPVEIPVSAAPSKSGVATKGVVVVGAAVGVAAVFAAAALFALRRQRTDKLDTLGGETVARKPAGTSFRKPNGGGGNEEGNVGDLVMVHEEKQAFGLSDLLKSAAEVLGNGGMGSAYKVVMASGETVAVKRIRGMNRVGKDAFHIEMQRLGKLRHRNVLTPLAYHFRTEEKLVVLEYISRGSLLYLLHGEKTSRRPTLDWPARLKIIRGIARGMAYLHIELSSLDVPHGNLKSGNVLVDAEYEPLIVDYGFHSMLSSSMAPNPMLAYKAPEYTRLHHVVAKSDVYCLGIVILEVLTGKFPCQYSSNAEGGTDVGQWAVSAIVDRREAEILDRALVAASAYAVPDMERLLRVGAACVEPSLERRPGMQEAAASIEEITSAAADGTADLGEVVSVVPL